MAKSGSSGAGGAIGVLLALLIVGGLVGTPAYLAYLSSEKAQANQTLSAPVENLRRVVLGIDHGLKSISDLQAGAGETLRIEQDDVAALLEKNPDLLDKSVEESIKASTQALQALDRKDNERGTAVAGPRVAAVGKPNFSKAANDLRNKYIKQHNELLDKAKGAIRELQTGGGAATNRHLGANRAKAILEFAKARIQSNLARMEARQASQLRLHAETMLSSAAGLAGSRDRARAEQPTQLLAHLDMTLAATEQQINLLGSQVQEIGRKIEDGDGLVAQLESIAIAARTRMAELERSGATLHGINSEYRERAREARDAEAKAEVYRNGTLLDATRVWDPADPEAIPQYEGGAAQPGLRDLKLRYAQLSEALVAAKAYRSQLLERKDEATEVSRALTSAEDASETALQTARQEAEALMEKADERLKAADTAWEDAVKMFAQCQKYAASGASAASNTKREAQRMLGQAKGPEADRLRMVSNDGDMEASMQCLVAEAAYASANARAAQISMHVAANATKDRLGRSGTSGGRLDELRQAGVNRLVEATQAFEKAGKLIAGTSASSGRITIQGKNYAWQISVGLAAVKMLHAALLEGDAAFEQKSAAYNLLTEVVKDRENSPVLSPAVRTLLYLQQNAH